MREQDRDQGHGPGQIVGVRSAWNSADYRADRKWGEYLPYCDAFYFAVSPDFPHEALPVEPGLIAADAFGGAVLREPSASPLAPARRKALTVAFGRLAALRLAEG